jgi:PAS domain S-box-containing protein
MSISSPSPDRSAIAPSFRPQLLVLPLLLPIAGMAALIWQVETWQVPQWQGCLAMAIASWIGVPLAMAAGLAWLMARRLFSQFPPAGQVNPGSETTDCEKTKAELHKTQQWLAQHSRLCPSSVYTLVREPDGHLWFEYVSGAVEKIHELPVGAVMQDATLIINAVHPDDRAGYEAAVMESMQTMQPFFHEWRIITPSGKTRWEQAHSQPERRTNGAIAWHGVVIDITEQKKAVLALQQTETLNQAIFNTLPDLIIRAHRDGTYLDIKPATTFPSDLPNFKVGENIRNVVPAAIATRQFAAMEQALQTGDMQVYEFPITVQGQDLWQESRTIPLSNDEVLIVIRDLTQHQQAEAALKEREAMLRAIGDNLPKGFIYQRTYEPGKGFYYSYVSAGIERLLGLKPEDVLNDSGLSRSVGFEEDLALADQVAQESLKHLTNIELQMRHRTPEGDVGWSSIRSTPRRLEDGRTVWEGVEVDITDFKRTEAALQASEEQFRRTFDDAPIGISLVSTEGKFLKVNRRYCELLGYSEAEFLQLNFSEITHPDDLTEDLAGFQQMLMGEIDSFCMEKRYISRQGNEIPVLMNAAFVRDQEGKPLYSIGHIQDIRNRLEVERMKDEFVSIVSHELRTPITSIQGSLMLLGSGVYDNRPEQAKNMLQIAIKNSNRLVRLVDDILSFERLESGKVQLVMGTCQVKDLMAQAVEGVQAIATQANVTLSVTPLPTTLYAVPDAIIQALTNLLSNAIKFSPPHSTVWLEAKIWAATEDCKQAWSNALPTPFIRFSVKDQGRGIPTTKLDRIFEAFQQVDGSDARQKGGTGLGLAICKRIVEQHGGQIWVESCLGQGSTFFFTLPCSHGEAA